MSRPEMVFNLMWEDSKKERHKIGMFAQTDSYFYLVMSNEKNIGESLKTEYVGIPGLKAGGVYRSDRVFDFIERRIGKKELDNPGEAIIKRNGGRSFVDSFFFEEVPKGLAASNITMVKQMYEYQEKLRELSARADL